MVPSEVGSRMMSGMDLTVQDVVEKLPVSMLPYSVMDMVVSSKVDTDRIISRALLYSDGVQVCDLSAIYLCVPSDLPLPPAFQNASVLCVTGNKNIAVAAGEDRILWAVCSSDIKTVYNVLEQEIVINRMIANMDLLRGVREGTSVDEVLQRGKMVFTNPFALVNAAFKVVGYSEGRATGYEPWDDSVYNGELDSLFVASLFDTGIIKRALGEGFCLVDNGSILPFPLLIVAIRNGEGLLGYGLLTCSKTAPSQRMLTAFSAFIREFSPYLSRGTDSGDAVTNRSELFLRGLLEGGFSTSQDVLTRAERLGLPMSGGYKLLKLDFRVDSPLPIDFVRRQLSELFSLGWSFSANGAIFILLERNHALWYRDKVDTDAFWDSVIARYNLKVGVSETFFSLSDIGGAAYQCDAAIRFGMLMGGRKDLGLLFSYRRCGHDVFDYDMFSVIDGIESVSNRGGNLPACPTGLEPILDLPEQRRRDALRTLACYIEHGCRVAPTAEALSIHRNTLLYRLGKLPGFDEVDARLKEATYMVRVLSWLVSLDYQAVLDFIGSSLPLSADVGNWSK